MTSDAKIRVLVVDDSAFMRTALRRMIDSEPSMSVVGTAQDGIQGLEMVKTLQPDVVTLDIEMPRMNGLQTLKRLMTEAPRPVIMVSSLTQEGAQVSLEALDLGAFDYIAKQCSFASLDIVKVKDDLVAKIKAAAESYAGRKKPRGRSIPTTEATKGGSCSVAKGWSTVPPSIIAIGTSTGGPKALQEVLPRLPGDLPVGIVIVQHMPLGFTGPFARRLNNTCQISVCEAQQGDVVKAGVAYIAPAGLQMTVQCASPGKALIRLSHEPTDMLHTPSVDVLMLSVAQEFQGLGMGIILTGMGADGAVGMKAILEAGGKTLGQDEASCVVYGMPRSCAEAGILQRVVSLRQVPDQIMMVSHYRRRTSATRG